MELNHPYFLPIEPRSLEPIEFAVVTRLLAASPQHYKDQVQDLNVVGRCGCGSCPTIYFREPVSPESDLVTCHGRDDSGGAVGVVLLTSDDKLSQLDFWSLDGHEPWSSANPESLEQI
jgi:hypothetical protein